MSSDLKRYKAVSQNAGVYAFAAGKDSITIQFQDGRIYLYNYDIPGRAKVEEMKKLAEAGRGLTTFINQHVREQYAAKLK